MKKSMNSNITKIGEKQFAPGMKTTKYDSPNYKFSLTTDGDTTDIIGTPKNIDYPTITGIGENNENCSFSLQQTIPIIGEEEIDKQIEILQNVKREICGLKNIM